MIGFLIYVLPAIYGQLMKSMKKYVINFRCVSHIVLARYGESCQVLKIS